MPIFSVDGLGEGPWIGSKKRLSRFGSARMPLILAHPAVVIRCAPRPLAYVGGPANRLEMALGAPSAKGEFFSSQEWAFIPRQNPIT